MIRRIVQKHLFLSLSVMMTFAGFFLVGLGLVQYSNEGGLPDVIGNHAKYLLLWRLLVYALVIAYWPRLVDAIAHTRYGSRPKELLYKAARRRQPVAVVCLAFELFIVQNIVGVLLAYIYAGTIG